MRTLHISELTPESFLLLHSFSAHVRMCQFVFIDSVTEGMQREAGRVKRVFDLSTRQWLQTLSFK